MQRLSIARSLRLTLGGLTIVLAVIAALGVASLYSARQGYENTLSRSSELAIAAANLESAQIAKQEVLRDVHGAAAAGARASATADYAGASSRARSLARGDAASERLVSAQLAAVSPSQVAAAAARLQAREQTRQNGARARARSDSRRAVVLIAVAAVLALAGALALISALIGSMRRPLDELVGATSGLAGGDFARRVRPSGPRELRELGTAFNTMGEELANASERLEEERRRLAVTIESLGDGLVVTEPGSTTIAALNPSATHLLPELTVGERTDSERSPLPELADALVRECTVEHGGRTLAVTAALLGAHDAGVVWTIRDMTERARLERAKSEFVATASHELRSPLTSIKGFVELLNRSPEGMSERQREFVEIILRSTDRLTDLVGDLLEVARIEADRVEIERRPIDVGEAVKEVAELLGQRIRDKHQQLTVYVAPTVPPARADPARVRQIVANLLTNAHNYTPHGGSIRVAVEPDRAWVQIVVQDTGVGMTEEQAERAFERFYRARDAASATPGTGLGLSIVKSLVELHDGQIEVESEPGHGTTFRVLLPAALAEAELTRSVEAIRGRRVLVVDDEHDIAELIAGQLAPLSVHVDIASSGPEALAMLRATYYDAITLDVLMPGMDGFDVLREIRADERLHATPIVFVSVFSVRQELAGEWVVSKPIDADELRHVLGAAVQAGRSRVLVVGREQMRDALESDLDTLGIEHEWQGSGGAAARACAERRFEIALIDVGVRNPQAVLQALDLRGRRRRRAAILFSDGVSPTPAGIGRLGMEVVPITEAAAAVDAVLRSNRPAPEG